MLKKITNFSFSEMAYSNLSYMNFDQVEFNETNLQKAKLMNTDFTKIKNKNILLAIGSRFLHETASYYKSCGANLFTRVLPTHESISKAFGSCIKNSNIAILEPSKKKESLLEKTLCDFWRIDYVLCRESGSYSQKNWERIIFGSNMKLFLVKRPELKYNNASVFYQYDTLVDHITRKY